MSVLRQRYKMAVYDEIIEISKKYLGFAAPDFVSNIDGFMGENLPKDKVNKLKKEIMNLV